MIRALFEESYRFSLHWVSLSLLELWPAAASMPMTRPACQALLPFWTTSWGRESKLQVTLTNKCKSILQLLLAIRCPQSPCLANPVLQLLQPIDDRHGHANKLARKQINYMTIDHWPLEFNLYGWPDEHLIKLIIVLIILTSFFSASGSGCGFPGAPAHSTVTFSPSDDNAREGTIAEYSCDR